MRYMITDELWVVMEPLVRQAKCYRRGPMPKVPDRQFFEALLYVARTSIPWRDLPSEFGEWDAIYNRFRRWEASGSLQALFELMTEDPQFEGLRRVFIDSTIVRAHQHAAGAQRKKKRSGRSARPRNKRWAAVVVV